MTLVDDHGGNFQLGLNRQKVFTTTSGRERHSVWREVCKIARRHGLLPQIQGTSLFVKRPNRIDGVPPGFSGQQNLSPSPDLKGTIFFPGAGFDGAYIDDFLTAFRDAGIQSVAAADPLFWSSNAPWNLGLVEDGRHAAFNRERDAFNSDFDLLPTGNSQQFNLIGYSYGATLAANIAMDYADAGGQVDNIVLIGAPIGPNILSELYENDNIKRVVIFDLNREGDPIKAGESDHNFFGDLYKIIPQYFSGKSTGHFLYGREIPEGDRLRRDFARNLVNSYGLQ
ncbi:MAG: hypothetical protein ACPGO3_15450 [Magnetospiraceae bacterium]